MTNIFEKYTAVPTHVKDIKFLGHNLTVAYDWYDPHPTWCPTGDAVIVSISKDNVDITTLLKAHIDDIEEIIIDTH